MAQTKTTQHGVSGLPIHSFSHCHDGLRAQLRSLTQAAQQTGAPPHARAFTLQALESLRVAMFDHHGEEENELFPAVLAASNTAEYAELRAMADLLTVEHRRIEALWLALEPGLAQRALGDAVQLDPALLTDLVTRYDAHARQEEEQFLPLAETILARKDPSMAALGLSLHMRHQLRAASRAGTSTPAPPDPRTA